jgi:hypothetical protein
MSTCPIAMGVDVALFEGDATGRPDGISGFRTVTEM